jgi:hypothetical protein
MKSTESLDHLGSESGLTMTEILVALFVTGVVVSLALKVFNFYSAQSKNQVRIANAQTQLLPIQAALERNLRRAMYQIPAKSPGLNSLGGTDTLYGIVYFSNGTRPDGIVVRGVFAGVRTNARNAFSKNNPTILIRPGSTSSFKIGDTLVLGNSDEYEFAVVRGVDILNHVLTTGIRLYDYPIGTQIAKVNSVSFLPRDSVLTQYTDARAYQLTDQLEDLRFYGIGFGGAVDSVGPFDINRLKSIQFLAEVRIPKVGQSGYLFRKVSGEVTLRNSK